LLGTKNLANCTYYIPPRELTYPTLGKGKSSSKVVFETPLKIGPCDAFSFYKPKPPIK